MSDEGGLPDSFYDKISDMTHVVGGKVIQCPHCQRTCRVGENTVFTICGGCRQTYSVTKENTLNG